MRAESFDLVHKLFMTRTMPTPIVELGGAEANRQFKDLFEYEVWDRRVTKDVDKFFDVILPDVVREKSQYAATLLCFDTLEHVRDIHVASKMIGAIVKQNGLLVLGVPMCFPFHDRAGDYWRFTPMGLIALFENDFDVVDCGEYGEEVVVGSWGTTHTSSYYIGIRK